MHDRIEIIAGLRTTIIAPQKDPTALVAFLHGYAMQPSDLVPFAHSMGAAVTFYFPQAPHVAEPAGHAWWNIDLDRRRAALAQGPRDLADEYPAGRELMRAQLIQFIASIRRDRGHLPIVLAGFSQGGMAICDLLTHEDVSVDAIALMSTSRLAFEEWRRGSHRLSGLPILVSHGSEDDDLSFLAGERLRDWLSDSGAHITWVPFDGGHQIPLLVWRRLRQFLAKISTVRSA
jgi:phospholipase/carboxylesterase